MTIKELRELCKNIKKEIKEGVYDWCSNDPATGRFKTTYSGATRMIDYEYCFAENVIDEIDESNIFGAALTAHMKKFIKDYFKDLNNMFKEAENEYFNEQKIIIDELVSTGEYDNCESYELAEAADNEMRYTYIYEDYCELLELLEYNKYIYKLYDFIKK